MKEFSLNLDDRENPFTVWKVSKYGVISGPYFSVFSPDTGKYELRIWTIFTQCYLFGEKFEDKFSPAYNKENQPSLWGQTKTSPFYQVLYQKTDKEEVHVVEGEDFFSQEK